MSYPGFAQPECDRPSYSISNLDYPTTRPACAPWLLLRQSFASIFASDFRSRTSDEVHARLFTFFFLEPGLYHGIELHPVHRSLYFVFERSLAIHR
jgi:hypothetical protein